MIDWQTEERRFHKLDALGHGEYADNFLHDLRHNLKRQGGPGEN